MVMAWLLIVFSHFGHDPYARRLYLAQPCTSRTFLKIRKR